MAKTTLKKGDLVKVRGLAHLGTARVTTTNGLDFGMVGIRFTRLADRKVRYTMASDLRRARSR